MSNPVGVLTEFAYFLLLAARDHLLRQASGGGQPNINQDKIRSLRVPTPPIAEQQQIVEYLQQKTTSTQLLIAKADQLIVLSKERRSALITAAVTGQIDVRAAA